MYVKINISTTRSLLLQDSTDSTYAHLILHTRLIKADHLIYLFIPYPAFPLNRLKTANVTHEAVLYWSIKVGIVYFVWQRLSG